MTGNEVLQRQLEIENLVASNELNDATKRLMDFFQDFSANRERKREVINIRATYNSIREVIRSYGITDDRTNQQLIRLRNQILEFLDLLIEEYEQPLEEQGLATINPIVDTQLADGKQPPEKTKKKLGNEKKRTSTAAKTRTDIVFQGKGITKVRNNKSLSFTLHPIDITLKLGEITAVVGENGNGKTTLLRIIAGDLLKSEGQLDYTYLTENDKNNFYYIKQQIAYIAQELPKWHGILEDNLYFAVASRGIPERENQDEVDFVISRLGLEKYRKVTWKEISGGYKMRFSLAKAIVCNPQLLILDEPLGNLDVNAQTIFLQDLKNLANSATRPLSILISSQHLYELEAVADQIIFLKEGATLYNGSLRSFGEDRNSNSYEIEFDANVSKDQLMDLLQMSSYESIEIVGKNFIINTAREVTSANLLEIFLQAGINVKYFRDISKSTRKLFSDSYVSNPEEDS